MEGGRKKERGCETYGSLRYGTLDHLFGLGIDA